MRSLGLWLTITQETTSIFQYEAAIRLYSDRKCVLTIDKSRYEICYTSHGALSCSVNGTDKLLIKSVCFY